ncbi:MAG TPA: hypothetical protein VIV63_17455, partial [Steroidobacteraceae bacterium]
RNWLRALRKIRLFTETLAFGDERQAGIAPCEYARPAFDVLSTYAGAKGGLGALSLAKKSRDCLLEATKLDPAALKGSLNPDGMDPNYFIGELLYEKGEYSRSLQHLQKALAAPPRPDRPVADAGRRAEIDTLVAKVRTKLE